MHASKIIKKSKIHCILCDVLLRLLNFVLAELQHVFFIVFFLLLFIYTAPPTPFLLLRLFLGTRLCFHPLLTVGVGDHKS